jgi:uncharacterized protein YfaS (alpha-2-macroglobulin family)
MSDEENANGNDETQRVEQLTFKMLDEPLAPDEAAELDQLLADPKAAKLHLALIQQEAVLRGGRSDFDITAAALEKVRRAHHATEQAARRDNAPSAQSRAWFAGKAFWGVLAAAATLIVAVTLPIAQWVDDVASQEVVVIGQNTLSPGVAGSLRVLVRDGKRQRPIAGAQVRLAVHDSDGRAVWRETIETDEQGFVLARPLLLASSPKGRYTLKARATSKLGASELSRSLNVQRRYRLFVTTDKPLYQPGQRIRIRVMALDSADLRPVAGRALQLEVRDAKHNKVMKKRLQTSRFGIAWADFQLAEQVNLGRYAISISAGDTSSERHVRVRRYRLPRFRVTLTSNRAYYLPGETVRGTLVARYTFGAPVANARVRLAAAELVAKPRTFASLEGLTDHAGRMRFELPLKRHFVGQAIAKGDAPVSLKATVQDSAKHEVSASRTITITAAPLRVEVIPESGELVPGVANRLYVVAAYPDGRFAEVRGTLRFQSKTQKLSIDGLGVVEVTPRGRNTWIELDARDSKGRAGRVARNLVIDRTSQALLLRPDRAIYRSGQTARLDVLAPGHSGLVFVDVVKQRRTLLTRHLVVKNGKATLALDLAPQLFGTLSLHAYRIRADGELLGDTRLIQVNRADDLRITAKLDRAQYRPGQRARLALTVKRRDGSPVQAALGLSGVDEAVFALSEARPGLVQVFFALQRELLESRYQRGVRLFADPTELVKGSAGDKPQRRASREMAGQALFAAASEPSPKAGQAHALLPPTAATTRYRQRRLVQKQFVKKRLHVTAATAAIALLTVFALIVLPLLWAGLPRSRPPLAGDPQRTKQLQQAVSRIGLWWSVGWHLPLIIIALMLIVPSNAAVVGGLALGGVAMLLSLSMQIRWVLQLRRLELSDELPLLQRLLASLPAAYIAALGAFFLLAVAQSHPRALNELTGVALVIATLLAATMVVAAVSVLSRSLAQPITTARRWTWVGLSALGLVVLLLVAGSFFVLVGGVKRAPDIRVSSKAAQDSMPSSGSSSTPAPSARARVRRHFPETLIWRPQIITDPHGKAELEIPLADSITTWRLGLDAVSAAGELGATSAALVVFQDFFVDLDLPLTMTQNDRVRVPVSVYNYRDEPLTVKLALDPAPWYRLTGPRTATVQIAARKAAVAHITLTALRPGKHKLLVRAQAGTVGDAVERAVRVRPDGKRVVRVASGRLLDKTEHALVIPQRAIKGASDLQLKLYPGAFSQLVEGLDSIFKMPHGCFEQTSSTTYPNVLALAYLEQSGHVRPELALKARSYINQGYQRLLTFEVDGGGFEWFGKSPAHTVLTAYGLMEFADMAKVHPVDPALIKRTREWLLSKQTAEGFWEPPRRGIAEGAINRQRGRRLRTTAYITWAALESLERTATPEARLGRALDYIVAAANKQNDPYTLALVANALLAGGRNDAARQVLARLEKSKHKRSSKSGVFWRSRTQGVTFSKGDVLAIETTALVAYALLKESAGSSAGKSSAGKSSSGTTLAALSWLVSQKDSRGTWHSTQATVLALRALLAGTRPPKLDAAEQVTVRVNGQVVRTIAITRQTVDLFHQVSLRDTLRVGKNRVTLALSGAKKSQPSYQIVATHYLPHTKRSTERKQQPLTIEQRFDATRLEQGNRLSATVTLRYHLPGSADMLIVDLGIPAGFAVEPGTFDLLVKHGLIERYTIAGSQVTLYIRGVSANKPLSFIYHLRAKYPVRVSAPPARTYQYYQPKIRDQTQPVRLTIL